MVADCGLATAGQRLLGGPYAPCELDEMDSTGSCTGSAAASSGKGSGVARRLCSHLGEQGAARGGGDETSSALGPDFVEQSNRERKRWKLCRRPRRTSSRISRRLYRPKKDLDKLMQEAPLPVVPVPQVNVSLVQTLEALTDITENMWNPDAGQPPDRLIHAIQESRAIPQT